MGLRQWVVSVRTAYNGQVGLQSRLTSAKPVPLEPHRLLPCSHRGLWCLLGYLSMPDLLNEVWADACTSFCAMWESWVHFTARQAALQRRIMEQERMIALTKAIITLSRTCRALCRFMSPFTRGILFDHHSNPMHKLGWQFSSSHKEENCGAERLRGEQKLTQDVSDKPVIQHHLLSSDYF